MKEIIGINHIATRVVDRDQAREFYKRQVILFLVGSIDPEPATIMEHPSGVNINLILNADPGIKRNI